VFPKEGSYGTVVRSRIEIKRSSRRNGVPTIVKYTTTVTSASVSVVMCKPQRELSRQDYSILEYDKCNLQKFVAEDPLKFTVPVEHVNVPPVPRFPNIESPCAAKR